MAITTRTYQVNDWRKTPCDCEEAITFGPLCPHQHWFPIPHLVTLVMDGDREIRRSCSEGKKLGGPRCRSWNESGCEHIEIARKVMTNTADENEYRRVELRNITNDRPHKPACPSCGETWCVSLADGAGKGRWKRKHRKQLKKGGEVPEELWMCRHPNCRDEKDLPWVWEEGTEERPKPKRHGIVINERLW